MPEDRLTAILDIAPCAIISVDGAQRISLFNQAAEKIFGYSASEVIGEPLDNLLPRRFVEAHRAHIQDFAASPIPMRRMGQRDSVSGRRKDGTEFPADASISKIEVGGEKVFTVILRDITERKQLEEGLRHAQKMDAIGQLAAGVAHELNNPLGAIVGYADMVLEQGNLDESSEAQVTRILKRAEQAAKIVRQLKEFAQPSEIQKGEVDLGQVIEESIMMVARHMALQEVVITTDLDPQTGSMWADADCLQQVFLNLALNASDAMPHGGELTITTRPSEDGRSVEITFADTGVGIPEENLGKIFDPFFTSGKNGQGTGLGLSISQRIVQDHGGHIRVKSVEGQGTSFTVVLPRGRTRWHLPPRLSPPGS